MPEPVKQGSRYMAGLDGLRAIAVFSVMLYHLNVPWAQGGLLGVGIFFVLSGYLITDLLVGEFLRTGEIDLKQFWLRRARRLLPAFLLMLLSVVLWISLFQGARLSLLKGDILASVLYASNWWLVFHHVSYFASFGPPSPFGHLWSLAVEEQFYLLWPLLLVFVFRFRPRRWLLVGVTLALATASAVAMGVLYQPGTDPSRVYYGTDTRAFALLLGAIAAIVWPSRKMSETTTRYKRLALDITGCLVLLFVLWMIWQTNAYQVSLYRGGLVCQSVVTAILVAILAHPSSRLARLLGSKPFRWAGVRSYGIYLWHFPIIALTTPMVDTSGSGDTLRGFLQVIASVTLAALSWRFVEDPIRRGALKRMWSSLRTLPRRYRFTARRLVPVAAVVLSITVSCLAMARSIPAATWNATWNETMAEAKQVTPVPPPKHASPSPSKSGFTSGPSNPQKRVIHVKPSQPALHGVNGSLVTGAKAHALQSTKGGTPSFPISNVVKPSPTTSAKSTSVSGRGITAFGDSVMIDIEPNLRKLLPGIVVDGKVGRQMYEAPSVVSALKAQGKLGNVVVIELGTNGPFTKDQLVSLLHSLGGRQIVLVNTRVPRPWERVVNATLSDVAATFPRTTLVNWYSASTGKDAWFYPDGVHLNPTGSQFYASLVANAIKQLRTR